MNESMRKYLAGIGAKGGSSTTARKRQAARKNAEKARIARARSRIVSSKANSKTAN